MILDSAAADNVVSSETVDITQLMSNPKDDTGPEDEDDAVIDGNLSDGDPYSAHASGYSSDNYNGALFSNAMTIYEIDDRTKRLYEIKNSMEKPRLHQQIRAPRSGPLRGC